MSSWKLKLRVARPTAPIAVDATVDIGDEVAVAALRVAALYARELAGLPKVGITDMASASGELLSVAQSWAANAVEA